MSLDTGTCLFRSYSARTRSLTTSRELRVFYVVVCPSHSCSAALMLHTFRLGFLLHIFGKLIDWLSRSFLVAAAGKWCRCCALAVGRFGFGCRFWIGLSRLRSAAISLCICCCDRHPAPVLVRTSAETYSTLLLAVRAVEVRVVREWVARLTGRLQHLRGQRGEGTCRVRTCEHMLGIGERT